jgi:hypothetical protein
MSTVTIFPSLVCVQLTIRTLFDEQALQQQLTGNYIQIVYKILLQETKVCSQLAFKRTVCQQ